MKTREVTNKLLELIEEGVLDAHQVLLCALTYLSEYQVKDMARINELIVEEDEEEEAL